VLAAMLALSFGGCALMLWLALDLSPHAVRLDTSLYSELRAANGSATASALVRLCNPTPFVYLAAVPVVIALARRRLSLALGAAMIVAGAIVTAELLKSKLGVSHPTASGYGSYVRHSWPSGTVTAATALACSLALVAPARLRPAAGLLGAAFAAAVVGSVLRLGWHYPSDTAGGVLVALAWAALTVAILFGCRPGQVDTVSQRWMRD
jgi:membrane-associated phospholipid phosphatase